MNEISTLRNFNGQTVQVLQHDGQLWLTADQVGRCLGYAAGNTGTGISNLYNRNADEFTGLDTCVINLMTQVQVQDTCSINLIEQGVGQTRATRIFSATGCNLLGFFSNTRRAKEFRMWAKQVLAGAMTGMAGRDNRAPIGPVRMMTRRHERLAMEYWLQGLSHGEVGKLVGLSKASVQRLVTGKQRFSPDAGRDETTPELIAAVVARHLSLERQRITSRYCASAVNAPLSQRLDAAGQAMIATHQALLWDAPAAVAA